VKTEEPRATADSPSGGEASAQFEWMPEAWLCGTASEVCRYCGRPVIFPPASLGIESCTRDHVGTHDIATAVRQATRKISLY